MNGGSALARALAAITAVALLTVVLQDAFEVMLLPRRVHRRVRLTRFLFDLGWAVWTAVGLRIRPGPSRERFLSVFGALSMVLLFVIWAAVLIVGFGLLDWSVRSGGDAASPLDEQIYLSGVTFFTLGYGDIVPHAALARFLAVLEAGTGFGFIAVVIGYLPVLYQLFSRREAHVLQLDGRAGSPPTACTMLIRHAEAGALAKLDDLLREWEVWGAELLESHLTYPMLVYYRSQHDNQSWLAALGAVTDACALILVGVEDLSPLQARMTFTMARQILVEMARSFGISPSRYSGGDRLPHADYLLMEQSLTQAGLAWKGGQDTEDLLSALRATYEPLLDGLANALLLSLPGWMALEDGTDHWERGHRGLIASRLIEQLAGRPPDEAAPDAAYEGSLAQRLRARLRPRS